MKTTVQLPLAGIVMPLKLSAVAPEVKEPGVVPAHVPVTLPAVAVIFTSVSVKAAPVRAVPLVFDSVRVTAEVPPDAMEEGLNALEIAGAARPVAGGATEISSRDQ